MRVTKEILEAVNRITEGCAVEITNCGMFDAFIIPSFYYGHLPTIEDLKDKIIIDNRHCRRLDNEL